MLLETWFALPLIAVGLAVAGPADLSARGNGLRQATRADIVRRASRPHSAKRATISNGQTPTSGNGNTFALQAGGTNNPNIDGTYAQVSGVNEKFGSSLANANVFKLDSSGHLIRTSDGYPAVAAGDPNFGSESDFYFGSAFTPAPQGSQSNGFYYVVCTVNSGSSQTLSCTLQGGSYPTYYLMICGGNLGISGGTAAGGCRVATISVYNAVA